MDTFNTSEEVESFHKYLGLTEKFCVAPFTTLLFEPDGKVGACRHKGCEFPVGNIFTQKFDDIWNGPFIKNWRSEFLEGQPKICSKEVRNVKCNHCPSYGALIHGAELKINQTKKPSRIAFNFNGHCNLECQMCHIWQKPNGEYDRIDFWNQLADVVTDLEEVELLSGEPFIQKDTYKLIDKISVLKPKAKWTFTTNANWKISSHIVDKLDKIDIKHIIVSLDSLNPETYSKIRKKGNLSKALATLEDLQKYNMTRLQRGLGGFKIRVNFLIQIDNWKELGHFQDFSERTGFDIFRTFLYEPAEHSLLSLPQSERKEIIQWYLDHLNSVQIKNSARVIRPLLAGLEKMDQAAFLFSLQDAFQTNESQHDQ